jgi:putative MATE family efflux protein
VSSNNQVVLDDERVGRLLLKLSMPAFIGMFVMTLYNVVDTIFIGRYVGPLGIAGLSIVFPVQMLAMGIGQMVGMGGASFISRSIGANNVPRAERTLGNVVTSVITLSAILMITGLADADFWLGLMGATETILPYARDYMTIILVGMFFQTFAMTLNGVIRAEGNARIPMVGMIIGALLNIVLDAIFIIPLGMGIKGAALATVIAQLTAMSFLLSYYFSGNNYLKLYIKNLAIEWNIVREIFAIGIASFARTATTSLSGILVNRLLVFYGGAFAVSAFGVLHRMIMFAIMPGIVIGQGLQPVLGFNYGAKRYHLALKTIRIAMIAAATFSMIVFAVLYFSPEPFIGIFTTDVELIATSSYAAKRVFLLLFFIGPMMTGSLIFQSIGKAVQSFITSTSRTVLFLLPLIFILPNFWQLDGVWMAFPIADGCTFLLTLILLVPQIKELIRMSKSDKAHALQAG